MVAATSIILSRLRAETADQHRSLEEALDLLRPDFDRIAYTRLVERFYGIFAAWEPAAGRLIASEVPNFLDSRLKMPLLLRDLSQLGVAVDNLPVCDALAHPGTAAEAMGAAYVFEGSTLGGQLLSRHFADRLGITTANGGSFFAGYGERTGAMWRKFRSALEAFTARTGAEAEIVGSARRTFEQVEQWLTRPHRM